MAYFDYVLHSYNVSTTNPLAGNMRASVVDNPQYEPMEMIDLTLTNPASAEILPHSPVDRSENRETDGSTSVSSRVRIAYNPQYGRFMQEDGHTTRMAESARGYEHPRITAVRSTLCDSGTYSEVRTSEPVYTTIT